MVSSRGEDNLPLSTGPWNCVAAEVHPQPCRGKRRIWLWVKGTWKSPQFQGPLPLVKSKLKSSKVKGYPRPQSWPCLNPAARLVPSPDLAVPGRRHQSHSPALPQPLTSSHPRPSRASPPASQHVTGTAATVPPPDTQGPERRPGSQAEELKGPEGWAEPGRAQSRAARAAGQRWVDDTVAPLSWASRTSKANAGRWRPRRDSCVGTAPGKGEGDEAVLHLNWAVGTQ